MRDFWNRVLTGLKRRRSTSTGATPQTYGHEHEPVYKRARLEEQSRSSAAASGATIESKDSNNDNAWLGPLPVDCIANIVQQLPIADAASLALCTRGLHAHIAKQPGILGALIYDDVARKDLLERLRRDMQQGVYLMSCEICQHPHPVPQRQGKEKKVKWKCDNQECEEASQHYFHAGFGFGDVQVLNQLHRKGDHDALSSYLNKISGTVVSSKSPYARVFAVTVATDGHVYVRRQEWCLFTSRQSKVQFPGAEFLSRRFDLCCHITNELGDEKFRQKHSNDIEDIEKGLRFLKMFGRLPEWHDGRIRRSDSVWKTTNLWECESCPTQYQFDYGSVGHDGVAAIVLTKWMYLGDAENRFSGAWRRHCQEGWDEKQIPMNASMKAIAVKDIFELQIRKGASGSRETPASADYVPKLKEIVLQDLLQK